MVRLSKMLLVLGGAAVALAFVPASPAGAAAVAAKKPAAVAVTAGKPSEFAFTLSKKTMPRGAVTFTVKNKGILPHDFKVCTAIAKKKLPNSCAGKATKTITPGKSAKLTVTFPKAGKHEFLCTISGHAAAGMKGVLTVS